MYAIFGVILLAVVFFLIRYFFFPSSCAAAVAPVSSSIPSHARIRGNQHDVFPMPHNNRTSFISVAAARRKPHPSSGRGLSSALSALSSGGSSSSYSSFDPQQEEVDNHHDDEEDEFSEEEEREDPEDDEADEDDDSMDIDDWKAHVHYISQDFVLLNSIDNLSKFRYCSPVIFEDIILLIEMYCKEYYKAIAPPSLPTTSDPRRKKKEVSKPRQLERCQKLQTQVIYALYEFTQDFMMLSATQYPPERQAIVLGNIREWTDTIKVILRNYTIHIIRNMREG
jgi:hypothetical protein